MKLHEAAWFVLLLNRSLKLRWKSMKYRCDSPRNRDFPRYGGRGIAVADAWRDYSTFQQWAVSHGFKINLTLDRRNNDGSYTPDNCRWVTHKINCQNQSVCEVRIENARRLGKRKDRATLIARVIETHIKPTLCVTTGEVFPSRKAAAQAKSCLQTAIANCLRGDAKTAGGLEWRSL